MTPAGRWWAFLIAGAGLVAFYLWGLAGLPGFGHYPGPYGTIVNQVAVAQTKATGVVSAINFDYRGFDTVGEEFILFVAATGVSTVLRHLRGERDRAAVDEALGRDAPPASDAVRMMALAFTGPTVIIGWYLASHAQTSPSGGSGETAWQRRARRSSMGVCLRSISPSVKSTAPCRAPAAWCWPAGVGRRRHRSGYRPPCRPGRRAVGGWRPRAGSGPPRRCAAARSPGRARRRTRVGGFQRVGAQGTAHAPHDHRRVQPGAGHVAHHQAELTGGQREHVVPVAADPAVPGHVPGGDLHAR